MPDGNGGIEYMRQGNRRVSERLKASVITLADGTPCRGYPAVCDGLEQSFQNAEFIAEKVMDVTAKLESISPAREKVSLHLPGGGKIDNLDLRDIPRIGVLLLTLYLALALHGCGPSAGRIKGFWEHIKKPVITQTAEVTTTNEASAIL